MTTVDAGPRAGAADLVVLDRGVVDRGAGEIGDARVLLTLSAGVAVHADSGFGW